MARSDQFPAERRTARSGIRNDFERCAPASGDVAAISRRCILRRSLASLAGLGVLCLVVAAGAAMAQAPAQTDDDQLARSIVERADRVRFPAQPFEVAVTISTRSDEETVEQRRYRVLAKGNDNTLVIATEPASERGQVMLMKGHDLWLYLPTVSQPVRLPLAQRLTGQVANGDLARANFAGDYAAKVLRTEEIEHEAFYVLELVAVDRSVTYHRVLYWVRKSDDRPYRAEFYSLSDRLLKTCVYENYRPMAGRERPTRLVMRNALRKDEESVLEYSNIHVRDLPDRMFTKDYLKRVE